MRATPDRQFPVAEDVYRLVNRSRRALWMAAARRLEGRGESIFAWQTVCYLARNGPTSQRDLAYANAQHPAGISRLVDELEAAGLVRRRSDRRDRRRLLVEVTAKGRSWFESVTPDVMAGVDAAMRALSRQERVLLRALLEKLLCEEPGEKNGHASLRSRTAQRSRNAVAAASK